MITVLSCRCGDCTHWEIIERQPTVDAEDKALKCKTCGKDFPITLTVPESDHLEWVERED